MPHHPVAWLHARGDETAAAVEGMSGPSAQRAFGELLAAFRAQAAEIVGRHEGLLVRAEVDVIGATLPLRTAVPCARELAECYEATLQPGVDRRWHATEERREKPRTCLSVGISFSGVTGPHDAERAAARAAQQGNSIAIVGTGPRGELLLLREWNDPSPPDLRLQAWMSLIRAGHPLGGTATALEALARTHGVASAGKEELQDLLAVLRALLQCSAADHSLSSADMDVLLEPFFLGAFAGGLAAELGSMSHELQIAQLIHADHPGAALPPLNRGEK